MLFKQIVSDEKMNKNFKSLRDNYGNYPEREFIESIFEDYIDKDGNFIEQFQSSGFDARLFELYFYAYLTQEGYEVNQIYDWPDYIVSDGIDKVAIELTTVNRSEKLDKLREENFPKSLDDVHDELAIRFGSSLFSKLKKKYWELDQCKDLPLVIAVEAFFGDDSLHYSSTALVHYLYGIKTKWHYDSNGKLIVNQVDNETHKLGGKEIPSGFFNQEGSENISAVIYTNSATVAKFKRVGYILGYNNGDLLIQRNGECYKDDPNSITPEKFSYEVGNPKYDEALGEGLIVCLNPNAKNPLRRDFFRNASLNEIVDGEVAYFAPEFSVYRSITNTIVFEKFKGKFKRVHVTELDKYFVEHKTLPHLLETEAYLSLCEEKMGVVVFDSFDDCFVALFFVKAKNSKYDFVGNTDNHNMSFKAREDILEFFENPHFNFA